MGLVLGADMSPEQMAEKIARVAARKQHHLAPYLVDGKHPVNPAQFAGIMRNLERCQERPTQEQEMARQFPVSSAGEARERANLPAIGDVIAGFYATPSRTGSNDYDFWKVTEGRKPGVRFVKRVIGGGDLKYPRLEPVSRQEQMAALGAILRTGIEKSREDYADNQQRCMRCGLHLTDQESRAARMGPVCREK